MKKEKLDLAMAMLQNLEASKNEVSDVELALQSLSKAANLMEDLKFHKMAEIVTKVMESASAKSR